MKIGSNDTGRPVINIPLTGTDQTQSAVIGPEGGTVTGDSGTQAIIPPGATDGNLAAAISPVPQEYLKIDSSEGIEVLGAVYFYIGDKVLSNNSELVIPKPDNFSAGSEILLGKIIHLPDKDLVLMVDTAHIEGNSIKTGAPAFPGAIISGTYVFYQNNTSCGVPDYQAFFAGKINPTCTDKLYLYIYFRTEAPILITQIQNLSNYIDGALNSNDAAQSVISIADTMATLNGLSGKTAEELIADSEGEMSGFMGTLYGGYWDIGALWIPLITCPITGSCAQELAVTVAGMWFNAWAATQVIYLGEEINNILIAQKFFELYYGYGRSQPLVAQSLGLAPGAGLDGIVEAVAKTVVNDPWWWPFPSYDVTKIKNIISTGEQWIGSIYKAAQSPWLSFVEGNPGIPGDGVFIGATITSDYDPHSEDFRLSNLIPLTQFANGFTLTIFFRSDTQPSISGFCIESTKVPEPCFKGACGITCTSFTTFFNGTEGLSYSCSQSDIKNAIDLANFATELHPGCEYLPPYTIDDFYINGIGFIYLQQQATPGPITTLDAAIILPGQNAVP